jgi:hypothetical protein
MPFRALEPKGSTDSRKTIIHGVCGSRTRPVSGPDYGGTVAATVAAGCVL